MKAKARALVLVACICLAVAAAVAHGDEEHVVGTVTKVTQNSISVKTTAKGTITTVAVVPETKFTKAKAASKITELSVGDRVVIHAKEVTEDNLVADTVEFSVTKSAQSNQPAHVPPPAH
jgi:hypothetical protein